MSKKRSRKGLDESDYSSDNDEKIDQSKQKKKIKSKKADEDNSDSATETDSDDQNWEDSNKKSKKNSNKKNKNNSSNKGTKRKSKAVVSESDNHNSSASEVEEGEVSDSDSEVFDDGYDDDLVGDAEDRRRLEEMTEKEREEEIYLRAERREALKTRFLIKKKMKEQKKKTKDKESSSGAHKSSSGTSSSHIPKASSSSSLSISKLNEDKSNVSINSNNSEANISQDSINMDRRKTNENKKKDTHVSKALENLKAVREKKKQQAEDKLRLEKLQQQQKKLRPEDVYSSCESDDNESSKSNQNKSSETSSSSDSDDDKVVSSDSSKLKQFITNKDQLTKIKLSRNKVQRWCHAPFFNKVSVGCFVKIGIGNQATGSVYRIAEVIQVVETPKVYSLGTAKTNKGFKLRIGGADKVFRLEYISNQPFSDSEFTRWKETMEKEGRILPTLQQIDQKEKEISEALEYQYNEEDVAHIVEEKKKFNKNSTKIAQLKIELLKQKEMAEQNNDIDKLKEIESELLELDTKGHDIDRKRTGNFAILAEINQRNRQLTSYAVEQAIRKDSENKEKDSHDPFTRRKCIPTLVSKSLSKKEGEQEPTKKEESKPNEAKSSGEAASNGNSLTIPKPPTSIGNIISDLAKQPSNKETKKSEDLYSVHNFEININLNTPLNDNQISLESSGSVNNTSNLPRRTLNLDAYKRQKGLI